MNAAYDRYSRPEQPLMGPQALYTATGHDISMGEGPYQVWFKDAEHAWRADLEWVLFHLEQFDEPSRHLILAGTAAHFGMPFEVVMGGML